MSENEKSIDKAKEDVLKSARRVAHCFSEFCGAGAFMDAVTALKLKLILLDKLERKKRGNDSL